MHLPVFIKLITTLFLKGLINFPALSPSDYKAVMKGNLCWISPGQMRGDFSSYYSLHNASSVSDVWSGLIHVTSHLKCCGLLYCKNPSLVTIVFLFHYHFV